MCCEAMLDTLFCVIAAFKNVFISPLTLAILCLDIKDWVGGNMEGWRMKACLYLAVAKVVLCFSVCVSQCIVFILQGQLLHQNSISFWLLFFPLKLELHLVGMELFMLLVWD